ncbi:hypothetical protein BJX64DRAFT_265634 [Aspergillus heterothallicus]
MIEGTRRKIYHYTSLLRCFHLVVRSRSLSSRYNRPSRIVLFFLLKLVLTAMENAMPRFFANGIMLP